jgi:hypothetical protein
MEEVDTEAVLVAAVDTREAADTEAADTEAAVMEVVVDGKEVADSEVADSEEADTEAAAVRHYIPYIIWLISAQCGRIGVVVLHNVCCVQSCQSVLCHDAVLTGKLVQACGGGSATTMRMEAANCSETSETNYWSIQLHIQQQAVLTGRLAAMNSMQCCALRLFGCGNWCLPLCVCVCVCVSETTTSCDHDSASFLK